MNKFKKYLEDSKEIHFTLMEFLIKKHLVKKHSDYNTILDILFAYHNFSDGFTWSTMKSYLVIKQYKEGDSTLKDSTAKQWVNRKIDKMIELGYASKGNIPDDKRKVFIEWTPKIKDLYSQIIDLFN